MFLFKKLLYTYNLEFFKTKSDKNVGFSHLDQCTPKFIAKKVIKLLPALCEHLESSNGFFQVRFPFVLYSLQVNMYVHVSKRKTYCLCNWKN